MRQLPAGYRVNPPARNGMAAHDDNTPAHNRMAHDHSIMQLLASNRMAHDRGTLQLLASNRVMRRRGRSRGQRESKKSGG